MHTQTQSCYLIMLSSVPDIQNVVCGIRHVYVVGLLFLSGLGYGMCL